MNTEQRSDIVIVGGVAAGPKAAACLARRLPDAKITLFQKDEHISYASCGLPYFASGDIDNFTALTRTSYDVVRNAEFFSKAKGFQAITNAEVMSVNRDKKIVVVKKDGKSFEHGYGKLILATGATPSRPPFPVAESHKIRPFTRPGDAIEFRKAAERGEAEKVVIVGGGFIGCELAEAAGGLWGLETVLVEKEEQLLSYVLDPEMAALVKNEMIKQDVNVMTGVRVEKIEVENDKPTVTVGGEKISADFVFLCMGVTPKISLAQNCGLTIGETGGIEVNSHMQTNDPDIYAGGDCVESRSRITGKKVFIPMGSLANRHGRVIAENLAGNPAEFPGVTGAFLIKVFDLNVGATGLTLKAAKHAGLKAQALFGSFPDKPDYYPEAGVFSLQMTCDGDRLLGLQAAGSGNICRRIDVFSAFLQKKGTVDDLLDLEQGYAPPYSEALDPLFHMASMMQAKKRGIEFASPGYAPDKASWLDVRETEEAFANPCPIEGVKNIPLGELRMRLDELDRDKKIMVFCKRGVRSYQATIILKQAGFADVCVAGGGMQALGR